MGLQVRTGVIFVVENRLQLPVCRVAVAFLFFTSQLNIACRCGQVIR